MALSASLSFFVQYTKSGAGVTGAAGSITVTIKKLTRGSSPTITTVTTGGAITVGSVTEVDSSLAKGVYVVGVSGLDPAADYIAGAHYTGTASDVDLVDVPALQSEFSASINGGAIPQVIAGAANGVLRAGSNAATTFDTLTVSNAFTVGSFAVTSGVTFGANFSISGQLTVNNIVVTTSTILSGAVVLGSTLGVNGLVTLAALTVTNATTFSGAVELSSTLTVTGAATFTAGIFGNLAGRVLGTGSGVFADVGVVATLNATQPSVTFTNLAITNDLIIGDDLLIAGDTTMTGAWTATNAGNDIVGVESSAGGVTGTAQAGSATTITLAATASAVDGQFVGQVITTNADNEDTQEIKSITGYVGATRVATVDSAWVTNPTAGTPYVIAGIAPASIVLTPFQATVQQPRVASINFEIGQSEVVTYTFIILDDNGDPVDLSGKTLNFVAWNSPNGGVTQVEAFSYSTADFVTVTGASSNEVEVEFQAVDTAEAPATYSYSLVRVTGGPYRLVTGTMKVTPGLLAPTL